jgi:hypothetical protein
VAAFVRILGGVDPERLTGVRRVVGDRMSCDQRAGAKPSDFSVPEGSWPCAMRGAFSVQSICSIRSERVATVGDRLQPGVDGAEQDQAGTGDGTLTVDGVDDGQGPARRPVAQLPHLVGELRLPTLIEGPRQGSSDDVFHHLRRGFDASMGSGHRGRNQSTPRVTPSAGCARLNGVRHGGRNQADRCSAASIRWPASMGSGHGGWNQRSRKTEPVTWKYICPCERRS